MRIIFFSVTVCVLAAAAPVFVCAAPPPAPMHVTTWFSLQDTTSIGRGRSLIVEPPREGAENIIVYAKRQAARDAAWRRDIAAAQLAYEPSQSPAAQRLYAPSPVWGGAEEQRWTSALKDSLGLCGLPVPGAQIDCPNAP